MAENKIVIPDSLKDFIRDDPILNTKNGLYFILDENKNVIEATCLEWSDFFSKFDSRKVGDTYIGKYWISTVFIGLATCISRIPFVFETMIFEEDSESFNGMKDTGYVNKYTTYEKAKKGHEEAIEFVELLIEKEKK